MVKEPPPALYASAMPLATTSWGQRPVSPGAGGMALAHHEGPGCRWDAPGVRRCLLPCPEAIGLCPREQVARPQPTARAQLLQLDTHYLPSRVQPARAMYSTRGNSMLNGCTSSFSCVEMI